MDEADALIERFKDLETSDDTASVAALLQKLPTPPGSAPAPKATAAPSNLGEESTMEGGRKRVCDSTCQS